MDLVPVPVLSPLTTPVSRVSLIRSRYCCSSLFVVGTGGGFSTNFSLRELVTSPSLVDEH